MIKASKISIIGGPGTGKSTLAENLSIKLNLPVYHIDAIHHLENWKIRDKDERDEIIIQKIKEDKWIMDGTYRSTLEKRIASSELVIYLDYSGIARIKGILNRYLKNANKEKFEIPGCKEKMSFEFLKFTLFWKKQKGETISKTLERYNEKEILVFKSRRKLNKWYLSNFNEKILLKF